jgi:hypothetical protein
MTISTEPPPHQKQPRVYAGICAGTKMVCKMIVSELQISLTFRLKCQRFLAFTKLEFTFTMRVASEEATRIMNVKQFTFTMRVASEEATRIMNVKPRLVII